MALGSSVASVGAADGVFVIDSFLPFFVFLETRAISSSVDVRGVGAGGAFLFWLMRMAS